MNGHDPLNRNAFPALLLVSGTLWPGVLHASAQVERRLHVMGTVLTVLVTTDTSAQPSLGAETAEAALRAIEAADALLSTWDEATPMSRTNRAPVGEAHPVPRELATLLSQAEAWAERTGRAFDPAVGALVDAWDLRGAGRHPSQAELDTALARSGVWGVRVDSAAATLTRLRDGAWMDTGAFGKGAALRAAADSLRSYGGARALLDLGGQLLAVAGPSEEPWEVAVAHPSRRDTAVTMLRLSDASVATSGNSERGLLVDGARVGHILDPRTGHPVPWWGSVTVVSADPMVADVLSTALYVMGPCDGLAWAEGLDDTGVLFLVESDGALTTLHNQAMKRWLQAPPASAGAIEPSSPERRIP